MDEANWLVAGLGNPGPEYEQTRHNAGFMLIDRLASRWDIGVRRSECRSVVGIRITGSNKVELAKPQTFMNLSGEAVSCLLEKDTRAVERLLIAVDDLALPFGTIRLRTKGSDGGHNGLKSVAHCLKTEEYARLRIGIRPEHPVSDAKRFVLDRFPKKDFDRMDEILDNAADAVEEVLESGMERAMSRYNS